MQQQAQASAGEQKDTFRVTSPSISLPKGGGAIRSIGEKFAANPANGTGSMSVPIATSSGRGGFGPQLALSYESGAGCGPFGLGWSLALPAITRKTDKGLPRYQDDQESDVFILGGAEDLVPILGADGLPTTQTVTVHGEQYRVRTYRPRIEGLFARIERWVKVGQPSVMFWRTLSRDNVTTWFGKSADSRIADPSDLTRIFQWFVCETHDDKGNVATYHYKQDDAANVVKTSVEESNRTDSQRTANCYPDRILYGNVKPYLPTLAATGTAWPGPNDVPAQHWMFEVVFDYTASDLAATPNTAPTNTSSWLVRADPFSSHRAGFEVRTYRLCRRVLMFHHFAAELGAADYLVRSTDFDYVQPAALSNPEQAGYTVLTSVTQRAYQKRNPADTHYESRSWPPVSFTYSEPHVDPTIHSIASNQLENLPIGTQGAGYQWLDLDGEGLSGVLTEQAGGWYYKPNRGDGKFGPLRTVAPQPAMALAGGSRHQFMDLAGNGAIDVVDFGGPTPGYYERDRDAGWKQHMPFTSLPNIDWQDPNLRFVDLTGDGHADALITESEVFTWYPSLDECGFAANERTQPVTDEDAGPRLVFADGTQTIFLADMCGDGLTDLVRIRNGEICYWPNLGYGRFGRKITLGNSPRFDHPDLFDPSRIRLTDIDGSGPIDIIYLGRDGARLYFNRSGNSFSDAHPVALPVATENLGAVQVADLLGNGTACLVWNSHLPSDAGHAVRYVDLMAGVRNSDADREAQRKHEKPHLLIKVDNNLGTTTAIEYTPSTHFYLQDLKAGTPWVTRLPFPVHCVSRVIATDKWRGTTFTSSYSYHHGYFDGAEREFGGFGRVEQTDSESYGAFAAGNLGSPWITQDSKLYQPPVKTITWVHTGAALDDQRLLTQFASEYFPQRYADRLPQQGGAFAECAPPEPVLPEDLTAEEWVEALRACKGKVLRQETYELDVDDLTGPAAKHTPVRLISAATQHCRIQRLQAHGARNRHAVFLVSESEAIRYYYELAIPRGNAPLVPDPRITHTLNLAIDAYGNVLEAAAAVYPRSASHADAALAPQTLALIHQVQNRERHLALSSTCYTQDIDEPHVRRLRMPCQTQTWEVTGIIPAGRYFTLAELQRRNLLANGVPEISYHQVADGTPQKRLLQCVRNLFFADDLQTPRPFGEHGPLGLPYESYKLALTTRLLNSVYVDQQRIAAALTALDQQAGSFPVSGYYQGSRLFAGHPVTPEALDQQYWIASGRAGFDPDADQHFYLPERYTDPFGNLTRLAYDGKYDLFVVSQVDALGNRSGIWLDETTRQPCFDYRVLAPSALVDANGNRSAAAFDILGRVVAAVTQGKGDDADDLGGFDYALANPAPAEVQAFCTARALNEPQAAAWLANASARFVYHFGELRDAAGALIRWADRPAGACAIARERHASQVARDPLRVNPLQVALECSDGGGNVLMKKLQAEPETANGPGRWIINGLTILNNKGKPVKQYEPAFCADFGCTLPPATGVTPVIYYDAAGRTVRTEMPDGTVSRVNFSPWHVQTFDANDTVLDSPWYQQNGRNLLDPGAAFPVTVPGMGSAPSADQRAGWLAAQHANTPTETHLDSLGRAVIAIAHNRTAGVDEKYLTFTKLDGEGKPLWIRDARGHLVMQYLAPAKAHNDPANILPANAVPGYDIAGNPLFQHSMDAGARWMLADAAGKPLLAWDINDAGNGTPSQKRLLRTAYDALHRPTGQWLTLDDAAPSLIEAFTYCDIRAYTDAHGAVIDQAGLDVARANNLIGQSVGHYDASGLSTVERIDLSGHPAHLTRTLARHDADGGSGVVNWDVADRASLLDNETFHQKSEYDALGRPTKHFNWHRLEVPRLAIRQPRYNRRGLLESEALLVRASSYSAVIPATALAIKAITYNAKGQKETLELGNGSVTEYSYDTMTFRLTRIKTRRPVPAGDQCSAAFVDPAVVQDLRYTYDPVGNIVQIFDAAQAVIHHGNQRIDPVNRYVYDALYRLVLAQGKENGGPTGAPTHNEGGSASAPCPAPDPAALRNYTQAYRYDRVGNIEQMRHAAAGGDWTRDYAYAFDDPAQAASNRLWQTWSSGDRTVATTYGYDTHGNMLKLANAPDDNRMHWDHRDMIRSINLGGGGMAFYQYDVGKQRTRKRIVNQNGLGGYWERIYLGGYERYRRYNGNGSILLEEIESHHLLEGEKRLLLVDDVIETDRKHADNTAYKAQPIYRYQLSNALGSACLELDDTAAIISYEEYHPHGTSAYRMMKSGVEAPAKRYRYTGMERDEESGLSYHTARYYLPWLGRWGSCDPLCPTSGLNCYVYTSNSPTGRVDSGGLADGKVQPKICFIDQTVSVEGYKKELTLLDGELTTSFEVEPNFSKQLSGSAVVGEKWSMNGSDAVFEGSSTYVTTNENLAGQKLPDLVRAEQISRQIKTGVKVTGFKVWFLHPSTVDALKKAGPVNQKAKFWSTWGGQHLKAAFELNNLTIDPASIEVKPLGAGFEVSGKVNPSSTNPTSMAKPAMPSEPTVVVDWDQVYENPKAAKTPVSSVGPKPSTIWSWYFMVQASSTASRQHTETMPDGTRQTVWDLGSGYQMPASPLDPHIPEALESETGYFLGFTDKKPDHLKLENQHEASAGSYFIFFTMIALMLMGG